MPSDHAFSLSQVHQDVVPGLRRQLAVLTKASTDCPPLSRGAVGRFRGVIRGRICRVVDFKQLLAVINAFHEIVRDQIHVAEVLVRILDQQGVLLLHL